MVKPFKQGMFRLGLGLTALFLFIGLYMRSFYIGSFYQPIDGYLIILPIARLAFMALAVAALIGLARPLSEVAVDAAPLLNPKLEWAAEDEGPKLYRELLYSFLLLAFYVSGYFMLAPRLGEAFAPLHGYGWVTLVFGLLWLGGGISIALRLAMRARKDYAMLRRWWAERKAGRLPAGRSAVAAEAAYPAASAGVRFCTRCGAPLKQSVSFCTRCGKEAT